MNVWAHTHTNTLWFYNNELSWTVHRTISKLQLATGKENLPPRAVKNKEIRRIEGSYLKSL